MNRLAEKIKQNFLFRHLSFCCYWECALRFSPRKKKKVNNVFKTYFIQLLKQSKGNFSQKIFLIYFFLVGFLPVELPTMEMPEFDRLALEVVLIVLALVFLLILGLLLMDYGLKRNIPSMSLLHKNKKGNWSYYPKNF